VIATVATYEEKLAKINERLDKEKEIARQLENQRRALETAAKAKQNKMDSYRNKIAGAIFFDFFPKYKNLQPKRSKAENNVEFAPLTNFLAALAGDREAVARYEEEAAGKLAAQTPPENQQQ